MAGVHGLNASLHEPSWIGVASCNFDHVSSRGSRRSAQSPSSHRCWRHKSVANPQLDGTLLATCICTSPRVPGTGPDRASHRNAVKRTMCIIAGGAKMSLVNEHCAPASGVGRGRMRSVPKVLVLPLDRCSCTQQDMHLAAGYGPRLTGAAVERHAHTTQPRPD